MSKKTVFLGIFLCVLLVTPFMMMAGGGVKSAFCQDVVFIGNADAPQDSLSTNDIRQIFLGLKRSWDNGQSLTIVVMRNSETHVGFLRQYIQRSPAQFVAYWRKMLFSGKGQMPRSFATDGEIVEFVAATPGAIGYVSPAASTGKVKVIAVSAN